MAAILAALLLVMSSEQVLAQDYQGQVVAVLQTTLLTVTYAGSYPPPQDYASPPPDVSPPLPAPTTYPPEAVSMTSYCYIPEERPCEGNACLSGLFANPGPASAFCTNYTTTINTDGFCPDFATGCANIISGLSSAW
jgi:hypothetical protein